ncbi:hypothetical protein MPH_08230 [Macrophomina phaseolina MS6]|uniref:Uncharacterized protein n=1 Tax=Macrophomina phaseolina (strain MS6) TaxID=1126212 RepID=K2SCN5_MACPH|nr:hypothetical protein MPH_08230 [Macrophomina phaseolina MS6]
MKDRAPRRVPPAEQPPITDVTGLEPCEAKHFLFFRRGSMGGQPGAKRQERTGKLAVVKCRRLLIRSARPGSLGLPSLSPLSSFPQKTRGPASGRRDSFLPFAPSPPRIWRKVCGEGSKR